MAIKDAKFKKGVSVIELLVVAFILCIVSAGFFGSFTLSLKTSYLVKNTTQANVLADGMVEAIRNFRDQTDWNADGLGTLSNGADYYLDQSLDSPAQWDFLPGQETVGVFARKAVLGAVYRDANDDIAESGALDSDTKKVTVSVSWEERGATKEVEIMTYITNWQD